MPSAPAFQITGLLRRWAEGDADAFDRLVPIVYDRLRQLARQRLRFAAHATLDTIGLVHEAYLRLADGPQLNRRDRAHFLALASRVMRHVLSDHARAPRGEARRRCHRAAPRGGRRGVSLSPFALSRPRAPLPPARG